MRTGVRSRQGPRNPRPAVPTLAAARWGRLQPDRFCADLPIVAALAVNAWHAITRGSRHERDAYEGWMPLDHAAHGDLRRKGHFVRLPGPEQALHQLTRREEQVLLGGVARLVVRGRSIVLAYRREPCAQGR